MDDSSQGPSKEVLYYQFYTIAGKLLTKDGRSNIFAIEDIKKLKISKDLKIEFCKKYTDRLMRDVQKDQIIFDKVSTRLVRRNLEIALIKHIEDSINGIL